MRPRSNLALLPLALALCGSNAGAQPCAPRWTAMGDGLNGAITSAVVFQGRLYVCGGFTQAGGAPVPGIASWDGHHWAPLALPLSGPEVPIGLAAGDLGGGPRLIVVGFPPTTGSSMGLYDGHAWTTIDSGPWHYGLATAAVFDSGHGPELYVSGPFVIQTVEGDTTYLARYDGSAWHDVAGGVGAIVTSYLPGREQGRPVLTMTGAIATAVPGTIGLARWDGARWTAIGGGIDAGSGMTLASFDDGSGEALYLGGLFNRVGGVPIESMARWDGRAWSSVGGGTDERVSALAVFDDGSGPALYAAGRFTAAGGVPATHMARWRHGAWTAVGSGVDGAIQSLTVYDPDGPGPAPATLVVSGSFASAGGLPTPNIAAWSACPCYANCDSSTSPPVLNVSDFVCFLNRFAAGDPRANCDGSTIPPVLNVNDFTCFLDAYAAGCP